MTDVDAPPAPTPPKPLDLVKSKQYVVLLLFGALVGIPVAAIAYYYLKLVTQGQKYFFTTLPGELGFHGAPVWWPLPMLALCGLIVGVTLRYLPGTGGHNPADGFAMGGDFTAKDLKLRGHLDLAGSPVVGAFLLLEAAGVGGGLISVILLPGLVASGVGESWCLVFGGGHGLAAG